jgi:hypothetical protein
VDQSLLENERERPHSHFVCLADALFGTGMPVRTGSSPPIDLSVLSVPEVMLFSKIEVTRLLLTFLFIE